MTLIQCLSPSLLENIAVYLHLLPKKLLLLGGSSAAAMRYEQLLLQRGHRVEIVRCPMGNDHPADIEELFLALVQQEECVLDLTCGDTAVSIAAGVLICNLPRGKWDNLRIVTYDLAGDRFRRLFGKSMSVPEVQISVEELIRLYGGDILPDSFQPLPTFQAAELDDLWEYVSRNPREWNRYLSVMIEFESRADSKTDVFLPLSAIAGEIRDFSEKEALMRECLALLHSKHAVINRSEENSLYYSYTSPLMRHCTFRAGTILETKVLLEAREYKEDDKPYFTDCRLGVTIDWDGIIYDQDDIPETRNEVDLVLMRGVTPLFVSCKNGNVDENELYKLHTVANRFGSPKAKKLLFATDLDRKSKIAEQHFTLRAKEMGIHLVSNVTGLSKADWGAIFRKAMGEE